MNTALQPLDGILHLKAYQPGTGETQTAGPIAKLAQNEAALGPSPKAVEAVRVAAAGIARYPDPSLEALREAIGCHYGIDGSRILCGTGSEALLHLIGRCYLRAGDEAVFSKHAFAMYPLVTRAADAVPVAVEDGSAFALDVDNFLAAITPRTRIVFIANPNNPTGAVLPPAEILRLRQALPSRVLLVLDAAYQDYMEGPNYRPGFDLVEPSVGSTVVLGTFSKAFGLAGLRLGWLYGPRSIVDVLARVRATFGVPQVTVEAALASLSDRLHLAQEIAHVRTYRPWLAQSLRALGCLVPPDSANFVLATLPEGPFGAADAFSFLAARGVLVRPVSNYGLPRTLRISVGPERELRMCVDALAEFLRTR